MPDLHLTGQPEPPGQPPHPRPSPSSRIHRLTPVGTIGGVHVEQLVAVQLVVVAALLLPGMNRPAAALTILLTVGTLVLTLTRWRGRWTYRSVYYALRRRRSRQRRGNLPESIVDELAPEVTIQELKVGRYRNLAALFDGDAWSLCLRVQPEGAVSGSRSALPAVLDALIADTEADGRDAAEFRVVHAALPAGRKTTPADAHQRPMPPAAEQTWVVCRVHELRGRYGDRPRPEPATVRRDLRRVVDRATEALRSRGLAVQALTVAEVRDDSRFLLGGLRHAPPEAERGPDPEGAATREGWQREPWVRATLPTPETAAVVTEQHRQATRRLDHTASQVSLGGAVHVGYNLRTWPKYDVAAWLSALDGVPASVLALGMTIGNHGAGRTAMSAVLRHTTGSSEQSDRAHRAVLAASQAHGVKLTRLDACHVRAPRSTTPLGPDSAEPDDADLPRFDLSTWTSAHPVDAAAVDSRLVVELVNEPDGAGVVFGYDTAGYPYRLPLFRPEPVWIGLVGPAELARVIGSAVLHADIPVRVAGTDVGAWSTAFGTLQRFDAMTPRPREQLRTEPWTPCLQVLDGCDPTSVFRPLLEPWQAGLWRFDERDPDLASHLRGVDMVLVSNCTAEQAAAVREALRLDLPAASWLTGIPEGMVAVIHDGRVDRVQVDERLRAMVAPPLTPFGSTAGLAGMPYPSVGPPVQAPWQPATEGVWLTTGPSTGTSSTRPMRHHAEEPRPRFSGPAPRQTTPLAPASDKASEIDQGLDSPRDPDEELRGKHGIPTHLRLAPPPDRHSSNGHGGRPPTST